MTLITTLEGFVLSIPAFFSNALQAFTTFIQKTTGISPADLHHILRWTGIFLLAFFLFLILKRLYHLWLPGHFARRYGISRLPKHTIIKRRFRLPLTRNSYVLRFPSWRYANQDKTRDQRRKGNKINWKNSCLMIDSYKIFMKNPMQMVRLVRGGEIVKLSKRSGKAITLVTLLDEVPIDAARFFFNLREPNTHCEFDLDLAVEQSSENPVYYVQYAHARICSILKNLAAEGISPRDFESCDFGLLTAPEETELIRHLAALTGEIIDAAVALDPSKITRYAVELATLFHKFYNSCRVRCDDEELMFSRLNLCICTKTVLKNVLELLKIDAPETM